MLHDSKTACQSYYKINMHENGQHTELFCEMGNTCMHVGTRNNIHHVQLIVIIYTVCTVPVL